MAFIGGNNKVKKQRIILHDNTGKVVFDGDDELFKQSYCGIGVLLGFPEPNYKVVDILCQANGWTAEYPPEYVELKLDEHDALLIEYSLTQRLKEATAELELLQQTKTRELTPAEREKLPATLIGYTREALQEQIDPWITLVSHYEGVLEDVCKAIKELQDG